MIKIKNEKITIEYDCIMTKTKKRPYSCTPVKIEIRFDGTVSGVDFHGWDDECEVCGSHGGTSLEIYKCPNCGQGHSIELCSY